MELRFMGIYVWIRAGRQAELFIRRQLPADRREDFRPWYAGRQQVFTYSDGARAYDIACWGKDLEVTMRQVGALSMAEVKQLQTSWNPGPGLPSGFMAIDAVDRPDVDQKVRENVANSLAWDKDLEQM